MTNWERELSLNWKTFSRALWPIVIVPLANNFLARLLGISPFIMLGVTGLFFVIWTVFHLANGEHRLAKERAMLDAKYEAQMARLIEDAAQLQK